nr:MAG: wsv289-like protein [Marsupenaeus japonicus pemonivirus]
MDGTSSVHRTSPSKITVEAVPQLAVRDAKCSAIPFNSRIRGHRPPFQVLPGTATRAIEKTGAIISNITEGALTNPSEARRRVLIDVSAVVIEANRNLTEEELSTKALLATINRQLKTLEAHEDKINCHSEDLNRVSQMTVRNLKTLANSLPTVINVPRECWSVDEDDHLEVDRAGACISLELSGAEGLAEVVGLLHIGTEEWERKRLTPLVIPGAVAIFYPLLDIFDAVITNSASTERSLHRPIVFRMRGTRLMITSPVVEMCAAASTRDSDTRSDGHRAGEGEEWSLSLPSEAHSRTSGLCKVVRVSHAKSPTGRVGSENGIGHFNQHPSIRRVEKLRASIDPIGRHSGGLPIAIHLPNVTRDVVSCPTRRSSCLDDPSPHNLDYCRRDDDYYYYYYFTGSCRLVTTESAGAFSINDQVQRARATCSSPLTTSALGGAKTLDEVAEMALKERTKSENRSASHSNAKVEESPPQGEREAKCPSPVGSRMVFYYWNHSDICSILRSSPGNLQMYLDTRILLGNVTSDSPVFADPTSTIVRALPVGDDGEDWTRVVAAAIVHDTGQFSATDLSFFPTIDRDTVKMMVTASSFDNGYNAEALSRLLVYNSLGGGRNITGSVNGARSIVVEATMKFGSSLNDTEDYEVWATGFVRALSIAVADRLDLDRRLGNGGEVRPPLVDHFLFPSEELMADRRNGPGLYSWDDPVRAVVELYRWVCETRIRRVSSAKVAHHSAGDWAAMHTAVLEHVLSPCFSAIVASGVWSMQSAREFMAWVVEDVILTSCSRTLAKRAALVLDRSTLDEMGRLALTWTVVLSASQNKGLCVAFSGGKPGPCSFYLEPGRDLAGATLSPIPSRLMKEPWRWLTRNRDDRRRNVSDRSKPISEAGISFPLSTSSLTPACYPRDILVVITGPPRARKRRRLDQIPRGALPSFIDYSPPPALIQYISHRDGSAGGNGGQSPVLPGFSAERASGMLEASLVSGATVNRSKVGDKQRSAKPSKLHSSSSLYAKTGADILEHVTLSLPCDESFGSGDANFTSATAATGTANRYVSIVNGQNEVVFWDPLLSRQSLIKAADSKSDSLPDLNDSDVAEVFLRERLDPILRGKMVFQPSIGAVDAASEGFRWLRRQLLSGGSDGLIIEGQASNTTKHLFSQTGDGETDDNDSGIDDDDGHDNNEEEEEEEEESYNIHKVWTEGVKGCTADISSGWWRDGGKIASTESLIRTILKALGPDETKSNDTHIKGFPVMRSSALRKFLAEDRAESTSGGSKSANATSSYSFRTVDVTDTELFLRQKFPYVLASIIQRLATVVGKDEVGIIHDVCTSVSSILADSLLIAVDPNITEQLLKSIPGGFGVSISGSDGSISLLDTEGADVGSPPCPSASKNKTNDTKESVAKHLASTMVPPPVSRLLSASELARLASSGAMNSLRQSSGHRPKRHVIVDRSAVPLSSLPHLSSLYVPTNPRKILTDDQWFDVLVHVESGTRQAAMQASEELELARKRGEQLASLALETSAMMKTNENLTEEQADWLQRRADSLVPSRDTALRNAAIITNTPKLVAIPSYNLSAIVRTLSDADYYCVIPNVWLGWNWIDIVTLAVRLALVPLAYCVSRGIVIGNKIAILFNSSSSLTQAEAALNS